MLPIPSGYEQIEVADDTPLQVGDIVDMEYPFLDQGNWIEMYHLAKIDEAFVKDDRVRLTTTSVNREKQTYTFRIEVLRSRSSTTTPLQMGLVISGTVLTVLVLASFFSGVAGTWLYLNKRRSRVVRKAGPEIKKVLEDPSTPEGVKEVIIEGLESEETTPSEAIVAASWAIGLLAGVVLIRMFLK